MGSAQFCPIGKLEKVLLATDGSAFSEGAIREAISFAKKCSSKLYAMSVMETNPEYETTSVNVFEKEESEALARLASIKARAAEEGLACETILHEGVEPYQAIVDEAAEKRVDMIVIGRRGRSGLLKVLMGEVASKVIAHAPCKVLVVPRAARIEHKTLLISTDGSAHSTAAATEAVAIAKRCGSTIIALSAMRDKSEEQEARSLVRKVVELGQREGLAVEALTPVGRPYDAIVETAGGRGVDLIVMGTFGKTGLKKLLMGSTTEKVIGKAGCAVLIVKAASEEM
ncbi:MAG TPA: universal stress protein [Thermodesulfovibrionales bacterium]|jgi:nucleotide-binding universal stress UspA family protein|nr:universal stress protein [Thermodesulfovibrionales bacterium]